MANEVFTRTPTSVGNRKKFTWAGWIKRNDINASGANSYQGIFAVGTSDGSEDTFMFSSDRIRLRCESGSDITTIEEFRDPGNWMHVMMVVDTTVYDADRRCVFYMNGRRSDWMSQEDNITQNADLRINSVDKHYLGEFPRINEHLDGQICDVFLVDGQALGPDVFGFYKDGDGYISSGTAKATDFRPGQWMPHSPSKIKKDINRRGGFGVNGFYLPMNDSSNPGADFHMTPNSIIKLKGEDLPQPRNGAPTTSDSYVSQLRTQTGELFNDGVVNFGGAGDRNALQDSGNGVNLGTGEFTVEAFVYHSILPQNSLQYIFMTTAQGNPNAFAFAVENDRIVAGSHAGSFSNSTKVEATFPVGSLKTGQWYHYAACRSGNTLRLFIDGKMMVEDTSHTENYNNTSAFGCRVGSEAGDGASSAGFKSIKGFMSNVRVVNGTALYTSNFTPPTSALTAVTNTILLCCQSPTSVTAAAVSPGTLSLLTHSGDMPAAAARNELDASIVLAIPGISGGQVTGIGDYSADIRGNGTNKNISANGNAGVGATGIYYGSALNLDVSNDNLVIANDSSGSISTDFSFGSSDFTVEYWQYNTSFSGTPGHGIWDSPNNQRSWLIYNNSSSKPRYYVSVDGVASVNINSDETVPTDQWNHYCMERVGSTLFGYLNGRCVGQNSNLGTQSLFTPVDYLKIGTWGDSSFSVKGFVQDFRIYKGVAKYKGGFDVPKPYTPVGIEAFRTVADTCKNNFCTWNSISPTFSGSNAVFSNGNLTTSEATSNVAQGTGTIGPSSGKWYYEARAENVTGSTHLIGIRAAEWNNANTQNSLAYRSNGAVYNYSTAATSQASYTTGDIIGIAFDATNGRLWFSKNGVWTTGTNPSAGSGQNVNYTPSATTAFFAFDNVSGTQLWDANFGQNPSFCGRITAGTNADDSGKGLFKYAPPTGFLALCEDNLPAPVIADPGKHFKTVLYTGTNTNRSVTGVGFKPGFVWTKERNGTEVPAFYDEVRKPPNVLYSSETNSEENNSGYLYSFDDDGFTVGTADLSNNAGGEYVAWCWKAGGAAVPNTEGSITAQVSANQTAGFSIAKWTGTGANGTIGHGLSTAPEIMFVKGLDNTDHWFVYSSSLTTSQYLYLNLTSTIASGANAWNSTAPTNSVFSIGDDGGVNGSSNDYIAYCWHGVEGFSKFGTFEGSDNADGAFVYLGFKPALVIAKNIQTAYTVGGSVATSWGMWDSSRMPNNPAGNPLWANLDSTETTRGNGSSANTGGEDGNGLGGFLMCDLLSNGFKARSAGSEFNSPGTNIYMAWAESPFQTANAK